DHRRRAHHHPPLLSRPVEDVPLSPVANAPPLWGAGRNADHPDREANSAPIARGARRAGLSGVGFHTLRHTCASLLVESGLSVLRLQRWMGHHSPAVTLEVYGHLLDGGDLGPPLDLRAEVRTVSGSPRAVVPPDRRNGAA